MSSSSPRLYHCVRASHRTCWTFRKSFGPRQSDSIRYRRARSTVEPPNKGHFGDNINSAVLSLIERLSSSGRFSMNRKYRNGSFWDPKQCPLYRGCPFLRGSFNKRPSEKCLSHTYYAAIQCVYMQDNILHVYTLYGCIISMCQTSNKGPSAI